MNNAQTSASFSKYRQLALNLDPGQIYFPGLIAQYGYQIGILQLYHPDEFRQLVIQRVRIAICRHQRQNKVFPADCDGIIDKGHSVPGYFGWRWQGHSDEASAIDMVQNRINSVLDLMAPEHYSLADLVILVNKVLPKIAPLSDQGAKPSWGSMQLYEILMKRSLFLYAQWCGIDKDRSYHPDRWRCLV